MRPNCLFAPCRPALEGGLAEEQPCELDGGKLDFLIFLLLIFFPKNFPARIARSTKCRNTQAFCNGLAFLYYIVRSAAYIRTPSDIHLQYNWQSKHSICLESNMAGYFTLKTTSLNVQQYPLYYSATLPLTHTLDHDSRYPRPLVHPVHHCI